MPGKLQIYAPFSKVEPTSDGGREVWGFASLEVVDKTGEIADFERTVQAFDKWSTEIDKATQGKSKGNIRYMHGSDAVGKMIDWKPSETTLEDGSTAKGVYIGVKVPAYETRTIGQIDDGILTGFSIGGNYADRWYDETAKAFRYAPELAETSLVDNPAVPGANFDLIRMQKGVIEVNDALFKVDAEMEKLHAAAEERAKKYSIGVKKGGHLTPPKGKPTDDADYGDPTNYAYPIDTSHVKAAVSYFNQDGMREKGEYTSAEWEVVGKRIADAANKLIGEGHEFTDGSIDTSEEQQAAEKAAWSELCKRAGVDGEMSYEDIRQLVSAEINKGNPMMDFWVCDTYPDYVIADDWETGKYWRVPYTLDGTTVTIGAPEEVTQGDWKPVKEATKSMPDNVLNTAIAPVTGAPVTKADPADNEVDAKIAALEKELEELKAAQAKDDEEDTKKALEALDILKAITGKLEKKGVAISATRRQHMMHAVDHIHKALGNDDMIQDKAHIDGAPPAEGMDAEKVAGVVMQKMAPTVDESLARTLANAGLAKAVEVSAVAEQLTKAAETLSALEGRVKAIEEAPQPGGAYNTSVWPGVGGQMPWQAEKAAVQNLLERTTDPVLKDALGRQVATEMLAAQYAAAGQRPTRQA